MELWTRGQGMKVTFSQVNPPEPEEGEGGGGGGGVALIEGIAPAGGGGGGDDEEEEGEPATTGAFNLRHQEATEADESAISNTVAPVCANQACQGIVVADATGQSMRVISMLGAVYANGFAPGEVAFRLPEE
jgi:hypothetical protein